MAASILTYIKLLLFLQYYSYGPASGTITTPQKPGSEFKNLFQLNNLDRDSSVLIDTVGIMKNLQKILNTNQTVSRLNIQTGYLTKFLTDVGLVLINYDDKDLNKLIDHLKDIVDERADELDKLCNHEIIVNYLKDVIRIWKDVKSTVLKLSIADKITGTAVDHFSMFFRNLNKFYSKSDEVVFKKLVKEFHNAEKNRNFRDPLYNAIQYVVFDKFQDAHKDIVKEFQNEVAILGDHIVAEFLLAGGMSINKIKSILHNYIENPDVQDNKLTDRQDLTTQSFIDKVTNLSKITVTQVLNKDTQGSRNFEAEIVAAMNNTHKLDDKIYENIIDIIEKDFSFTNYEDETAKTLEDVQTKIKKPFKSHIVNDLKVHSNLNVSKNIHNRVTQTTKFKKRKINFIDIENFNNKAWPHQNIRSTKEKSNRFKDIPINIKLSNKDETVKERKQPSIMMK